MLTRNIQLLKYAIVFYFSKQNMQTLARNEKSDKLAIIAGGTSDTIATVHNIQYVLC